MMKEQHVARRARRSILALGAAVGVGLLSAPEPAASRPVSVAALSGTSWQLVRIDGTGGQTKPDDGSKYTVTFGPDKRALIRADCNRGVASWHSIDDDLVFGRLKMTRVKCAPGSLDGRFADALGYVRWYDLRDGHLHLALRSARGTLELAPLK